jgi:beta-barrel assembly-enhancing protease
MKLFNLILILTFFSETFVCAQAYDVGIDFKKKGFIRNMNNNRKEVVIDFVDDKLISTELVKLTPDGKFTNLRPGMSVLVEGEFFRKTETNIAKKITQNADYSNKIKIENGRIDEIEADFAIIDGYKVKLKEGVIIKGINGYNKKFDTINQLLLGDIVEIKGYYYTDGFVYAESFTVQPDIDTDDDLKAKSGKLKAAHDFLYPLWIDKIKRKSLFGDSLFGLGPIVKNEALQDYVQNLGMKLIPPHVKSKINYIFIVVENEDWNANVRANGIAVIYTGLLKTIQNEAQLAAVLGHEIAHSIYEHSAKRDRDMNDALQKVKTINKANKIYAIVDKNLPQNKKSSINKDKIKIDSQLGSMLFNDLPNSFIAKQVYSDFSVKEESQADRVGLYLLTKAGYDPREATVVWQNEYNSNGGSWKIPKESFFDNLMDDVSKAKKPSLNSTSSQIFKSLVNTTTTNNAKLQKKTHPYDADRFANLHEMTYLFWSTDNILNKSTRGYESWITCLNRVVLDSKKK